MRYQVFNKQESSVQPIASAPWRRLAFWLASLMSTKWTACRVVDSRTGDTLLEWARANRPLVLGAEKATTCPILEQTADGKTVGRCSYNLPDGHTCPRHGDVTVEVERYATTSNLTLENAMRARKGQPLLGAN